LTVLTRPDNTVSRKAAAARSQSLSVCYLQRSAHTIWRQLASHLYCRVDSCPNNFIGVTRQQDFYHQPRRRDPASPGADGATAPETLRQKDCEALPQSGEQYPT